MEKVALNYIVMQFIDFDENNYGYEAPGIVSSRLCDITIVWGPKDMSLEKNVLILQKKTQKNTMIVIMNFYIK